MAPRRISSWTTFGATLLLISLAVAACGPAQAGPKGGAAASSHSGAAQLVSRIVPATSIQAQLAAHRPVVLLFMATGCASCAAQVGAWAEAIRAHPGVQAFGIDISSADTPHDLQFFLDEQDLAGAPLLWVIDRDGSLVTRYHTAALDATVGIDRNGVIQFQNPGATEAVQLGAQLAALLSA